MPPDYSDIEYWDARFQTESEPFEWLGIPNDLICDIKANLKTTSKDDHNVLHLGSGSSRISLILRRLVTEPYQVHNVDYSQHAIDLGKRMEKKAFAEELDKRMKWTCVNLLNSLDIHTFLNNDLFGCQYSLIVDKSTTDAVACGPDAILNPSIFRTTSTNIGNDDEIEGKVHPVTLLALHLAVMAAPDSHWLCLSFSKDRFHFFSDSEKQDDRLPSSLNIRKFWKLESVKPVAFENVEAKLNRDSAPVHRPEITYFLYALRRTSADLVLVI